MKATLQQSRFQLGPFVLSLIITLAIGFVASKFTMPEIPAWYATLNKPSFNPPNWVFGPVWTLLYVMIAIAAYLVWKRRDGSDLYGTTRTVYIIQLALNFSWSIVFFGMHQILGALLIIVLLWVSIVATMFYFSKFSKAACWMLLPYLLWVSFATALNLAIYMLNR